jgi:transposase-like protein
MRKTAQMRVIELERGKSIEQILTELVEAKLSWDDISQELGVSRLTLQDWRKKLGSRPSLRFQSETTLVGS